jgi:hypothetical protein
MIFQTLNLTNKDVEKEEHQVANTEYYNVK